MKDTNKLKEKVIEQLQTVYDPELPVNIYELGLIYEVNISPENNIKIIMTLTAPGCPAAQTLPLDVETTLRKIPNIKDVHVTVTWTPQWDRSMMSEAAQLELGMW